jgi:hypothetical protein
MLIERGLANDTLCHAQCLAQETMLLQVTPLPPVHFQQVKYHNVDNVDMTSYTAVSQVAVRST